MYMSMIALLSFINTAFSEIVPPDQPNAWLAAFGDSDASGTGAGDYIPGSEACFRYTQSYPEKLRHAGLKEGNDVINRACHGATIQDVQTVQLNPKEKSSVATLTVGKEDISWSAVLYNCVLRRHPLEPDDVNGFPPLSSCDDQLKQTHKHIDKDNITGKLSTLYTAIIENRQKDPKFRLYVLGYPMPFNDEKGSCSNLTLVRNHWRRHPDSSKHTDRADAGRPSVLLTQSRRHSINQVVRNLNSKIQEAVDRVSFHGVIYVDVDQFIINHRICDDDQTDQSLFETDKPNIYLYNYPYDYAKSADIAYTKIVNDSLHSGDFPILQKGQVSSTDVDHQILNDLIPLKAKQMLTPEKNLNDLWSFVGNEYKTFHYKPELHEKIQQFITNDYNQPKDQNTSFWILSSKYMDDHNVKTVRVDQGKFGVTIMQPLLNSVDSKAKTDTGNVWIHMQNGDSANNKGPYPLNCTSSSKEDKAKFQTIGKDNTTGLPQELEITPGNICDSSQQNWDGTTIRYGKQFVNVPAAMKKKECDPKSNCDQFQCSKTFQSEGEKVAVTICNGISL